MDGQNGQISADEVALYDRQIRLWGMAAQERMRTAHVLVISMKAVSHEVIKNLVLAGIGAITLLDDETVSEADLGAQFLITEEDVGVNRAEAAASNARRLNPRVTITVDQEDIQKKGDDYFSQFAIVVACNLDLAQIKRINGVCRQMKRPFYASEVPGLTGYVFADIVEHDFVIEKEELNTKGERCKVTVPQKESYISFEEALKHNYGSTLRPKLLKKVSPLLPLSLALLDYRAQHQRYPDPSDSGFVELAHQKVSSLGLPTSLLNADVIEGYLQGCQCELSAVAAIVGGVLSQDVLNVLSGREVPIQNIFVYDGNTGDGPIYKL